MGLREAIAAGIRKSFVWHGQATRSEFWSFAVPWALLASVLFLFVRKYVAVAHYDLLLLAFIAVNLPVLSAATRRLSDSGKLESRASYVGWGFSGLMAGPGQYVIWNDVVQRDGQIWMVVVMIIAPIAGLLALVYALSAPSQPDSSAPEVSQ